MARQTRNRNSSKPTGLRKAGGVTYRRVLERSLFILSLAGILVTLHLVMWYSPEIAGANDFVCGAGFDCQSVISSDPAPLGVSSSWWGFLFYVWLATLCVGIAKNVMGQGSLLKGIRLASVGIGLLYSLFLTVYQFIALDARCLLCFMSATVVALMAAVLYIAWRKPAPSAARSGAPVRELTFHGVAAVVALVVVAFDYSALPDRVSESAMTTSTADMNDALFDPSMCRYDPSTPTYENIEQLIRDYDPVVGPVDAPVTVMEFLDPNCNHCKNLHPIMVALAEAFPDSVRFVYKPVTVVGGPTYSLDEVMALWIANENGQFKEMLDLQFRNQSPATGLSPEQLIDFADDLGMDRNEFRSALLDGSQEPRAREVRRFFSGMGLTGVPAVIIGGRTVHGASRTLGCMQHFINEELAAART